MLRQDQPDMRFRTVHCASKATSRYEIARAFKPELPQHAAFAKERAAALAPAACAIVTMRSERLCLV